LQDICLVAHLMKPSDVSTEYLRLTQARTLKCRI
jgi:hypothetical protein